MSNQYQSIYKSRLQYLSWDSDFFGFRVGKILGEPSPIKLEHVLTQSQRDGYRLLYWFCRPDYFHRSEAHLVYAPCCIGESVTFRCDSSSHLIDNAVPKDGYYVEDYPCGPPSAILADLAIESGKYSRFRVDPQMPRGRFEALYNIWIRRSTLREYSDATIVIRNTAADIAGFVTVKKVDDTRGEIGLIAVSKRHRRRGLGRRLIGAAKCFIEEKGCPELSVATQAANAEAIQLYTATGFELADRQAVCHFWLG